MNSANDIRPSLGMSGLPRSYEFGPFVLDSLQHVLLKECKPVALTPKTYDMLLLFLENRGRLLLKEELLKALWPDSFVEESNLTQQVSMIRRALGESASDPRYIVTVPGRGYRFDGEVRISSDRDPRLSPNSQVQETIDEGEKLAGAPHSNAARIITLEGESSQAIGRQSAPAKFYARRWAWTAVTLFALLATAVLLIAKFTHPSPPKLMPAQTPRTLAILPLQNLKQDADSDFLGISLADAIITKLDYVNSLTVRPSTTVEKYRNQLIDIQKVAGELNVDTLLTGNFIRDGDKLRITYQLIDVKSDKLLGRGTIDLKYHDLLTLQDTVAQRIIKELEVKLSPSEAERIKLDVPVVPLAYEYYLRGVDLYGQHKFPMAIKMLEKSVEIDPNYAPAWAYLGASYTSDAAFEFGGSEQYRRAQAAYERALAIHPFQLDAQVFLANLLVDTGKVEQAVPLLRNALKTNPNNADVHWELGYAYRFAGMLNESLAECERARQIDPLVKSNGSVLNAYLYLGQYDNFLRSLPDVDDSSFLLFYRGLGEYYLKDFAAATRDFNRAYEVDPSLYAQIGRALSESIAQRQEAGLTILRGLETRIAQRGVGDPEAAYKISQAYSVLGDHTSALRVLRSSVEGGFFAFPYLASDPMLDPLRKEAEFAEILKISNQRHEAFRSRFF